jgi:hypothetical protein
MGWMLHYNPAKHRSDPCVKISSSALLISPIIFYGGLHDMIRVSISESHRLRFTVFRNVSDDDHSSGPSHMTK